MTNFETRNFQPRGNNNHFLKSLLLKKSGGKTSKFIIHIILSLILLSEIPITKGIVNKEEANKEKETERKK